MYETTRLAIALRMARAACQWTQQEMADRLGVTKSVITRNEKPDMAMRADTLVRLVYVMREEKVEIDVFSTLDCVRLYAEGEMLDAMAMRVARAALNISQQSFADQVGLTKPLVTRGERPDHKMQEPRFFTMADSLRNQGIKIDYVPIVSDLTVTIQRHAVELIEARSGSSALPGEPTQELIPTSFADKISGKTNKKHEVKDKV